MTYDPERHHRRSIRLKGYDYAQAGVYFVTICVQERACVFGEVENGEVRLSEIGEVAAACWEAIPGHFPDVDLDAFVVMPNHVHGILVLTGLPEMEAEGVMPTRVTHASPRGPRARSVGVIVGSFKAAVSRQVNAERGSAGASLWQRNYYERVIRNERELDRARVYTSPTSALSGG
jgi:REP element-mobilizing transposase RayT